MKPTYGFVHGIQVEYSLAYLHAKRLHISLAKWKMNYASGCQTRSHCHAQLYHYLPKFNTECISQWTDFVCKNKPTKFISSIPIKCSKHSGRVSTMKFFPTPLSPKNNK